MSGVRFIRQDAPTVSTGPGRARFTATTLLATTVLAVMAATIATPLSAAPAAASVELSFPAAAPTGPGSSASTASSDTGSSASTASSDTASSDTMSLVGTVAGDDVAAIEALLAERSRSVLSGDVVARAATLSPSATPELVSVDTRTVTSGEAVGLAHYVESLYEPIVDLTPPGATLIDGRRALTLEVRREMRIDGFDDRVHVSSLFLTFVVDGDGWAVAADDGLSSIGLGGDRELWELFDTSVERRDRVLVIGTSSQRRHQVLADLAEQAIQRFDASWSAPWTGRVVMIVPRQTSEIEALLQPTVDVSKFVAFTTLGVDRRNGWEVVAPRIIAQEGNLALRSAARQVEILVHELAHVASVVSSGPATPLWAHEGLAEWITADRPATSGGSIELPDLHQFRTGSSADIREVYDQAATTMAQLAGSYGDDAPTRLFDLVGAAVRVPGTADHVLDTALRELTGSGLAELTR